MVSPTQQPPPKYSGLKLRTGSPDTGPRPVLSVLVPVLVNVNEHVYVHEHKHARVIVDSLNARNGNSLITPKSWPEH